MPNGMVQEHSRFVQTVSLWFLSGRMHVRFVLQSSCLNFEASKWQYVQSLSNVLSRALHINGAELKRSRRQPVPQP
jgi:hypothetical protein